MRSPHHRLHRSVLHAPSKPKVDPPHPILSEPSYHRFRPLAFRNDRNVETAVGTPEDQLLVPPCAEEIADGPDQDEPADNHQPVG